MVKSKNLNPNKPALKAPTDYTLKWTGERADYFGTPKKDKYSFWVPVAPPGYVALGSVAHWNADKPPLDLVWCVRQDLTVPAKSGDAIFYKNSDKCVAIATTGIIKDPGEIHLTSGSFAPHDDALVRYALKVKMEQFAYEKQESPTFLANMHLGDITEYKKVSCSYIPTISVSGFPEIGGGMMKRLEKSQLLQVVVYDAFKLFGAESNNTSKEIGKEFTVTTGNEVQTFKEIMKNFSATVEAEYSYGNEVSMNKGRVFFSLSYGFGQTTSTTKTESKTTESKTTRQISPKTEEGLFKKVRRFELYFKDSAGNPQLLKTWDMTLEKNHWEERAL